MNERPLEMSAAEARQRFADVLNAASARGRITYITSRSRRVAAVVPLSIAERAEEEVTMPDLSAVEARLTAALANDDAGALPGIANEFEAAGLRELAGLLRTKSPEQLRQYLTFLE